MAKGPWEEHQVFIVNIRAMLKGNKEHNIITRLVMLKAYNVHQQKIHKCHHLKEKLSKSDYVNHAYRRQRFWLNQMGDNLWAIQ